MRLTGFYGMALSENRWQFSESLSEEEAIKVLDSYMAIYITDLAAADLANVQPKMVLKRKLEFMSCTRLGLTHRSSCASCTRVLLRSGTTSTSTRWRISLPR